ncbi:MAG: hypothetical protein ACO4B3_12555 [Planctomycetota bacterium]
MTRIFRDSNCHPIRAVERGTECFGIGALVDVILIVVKRFRSRDEALVQP